MTSDEGPGQRFGGAWTEEKLGILRQYLTAYTTALKSQPFELVYIDAFAGTGRREELRDSDGQLAFPELDDSDALDFFDGSARIALQCDPPFHRCVFIERDAKKCEQLEQVRKEWASHTIEIRQGDANEELRALASCNWSRRRAVLFLDPFGMQVNWETLEAVAATKAMDVWILFPLAALRMMPRSGQLPPAWGARLDAVFGTGDWRDRFYRADPQAHLFTGDDGLLRVANSERVALYYRERLSGIFAGAAEPARILYNSRNTPLFSLCFAVANEKGRTVALRIAKHILEHA